MINITIHLLSLHPNLTPDQVIARTKADGAQVILISGIPHGWVHKPHHQNVDQLLNHEWHLFIVTAASQIALRLDPGVAAHIEFKVGITEEQSKQLTQASSPKSADSIPKLPDEWTEPATANLHIPSDRITRETTADSGGPGTLKLDAAMASFLGNALPPAVAQNPVSLFNLFAYRNGDSAIHEQYMQDFKDGFGDSAGARVKFMGPVQTGFDSAVGGTAATGWQEANLTHYDSIYHYAYMLSTDLYQGLNKDKVRGLEDTCILLVSEVEITP